jgi:4-hydroxybenzoate polyprenyltransferase
VNQWLVLARPRQWVKNLLLFAALLFTAGDAWTPSDPGSWAPLALRAALGFIVFCALSSGGYFLNDARDAEADRTHPRKRERPVAAGRLSPSAALRAGAALLALASIMAFGLGVAFGLAAVAYAGGTLLYSAGVKHIPLVDSGVVAALFALRAAAGAFAIDVPASPWLVVCTFSGALFVAAVKRQQEARLLGPTVARHRSATGVSNAATTALAALVAGSGVATAGIYLAYVLIAENLPEDGSMMATAPLVAGGLARYWRVARAHADRDADEVVLRDPLLLVIVGAFVLVSLGLLTRG